MNQPLIIKISDSENVYGLYLLTDRSVEEAVKIPHCLSNIKLDCVFVHYLIKELKLCNYYRSCFINHWRIVLHIQLKVTKYDLIDYLWNEYIYFLIRERCELDHALSWLSTLGGAFSALGKLVWGILLFSLFGIIFR